MDNTFDNPLWLLREAAAIVEAARLDQEPLKMWEPLADMQRAVVQYLAAIGVSLEQATANGPTRHNFILSDGTHAMLVLVKPRPQGKKEDSSNA